MRSITTSLDIDAPAERVWAVLTDIGSYPSWNPFIREITGDLRVGGRLRVVLGPPGGRPMTFSPAVTRLEPGRVLAWLGALRWVFSGEHTFELTPLPEGRTRLDQREAFSGALVPLLWRWLDTDTRRGFEAMNVALAAELARRG